MKDMESVLDLSKVPFDQYGQLIAHYRKSGREAEAAKIEGAIMNYVDEMQRILAELQEALAKDDINEKNALIREMQKELEKTKIICPNFVA
jgi:hypothetical protein